MADRVEITEAVEATDSTGASTARERRSRRLRVAVLAVLLVLGLGVLAFRYVAASSYSESCAGVGVGVPVNPPADVDPRLMEGASTPRDALDAFLDAAPSTGLGRYVQRVDSTGAPDPSAAVATANDFTFHNGDHPTYSLALGHGSRAVLDLSDRTGRWMVTGIEGCNRD